MSLLKSYPRTPAQIAASRLNGQKSRGPVTARGKRVSSQNALRHGLSAASPIIKGEDPAAFQALLNEFHATYSPVGLPEELCVFHMAAAHWKLLRATLFEADLINEHIDLNALAVPPNSSDLEATAIRRASRALNTIEARPHSLTSLRFHTTTLERSVERHFRKLIALQALRGATTTTNAAPPPPNSEIHPNDSLIS